MVKYGTKYLVLDVKKYVFPYNLISKYTSVFNKNVTEKYRVSGSRK